MIRLKYCSFILPIAILAYGCTKKTAKLEGPAPKPLTNTAVTKGLPPDPGKINGYFYADFYGHGAFCVIANPARALTKSSKGNVNAGDVKMNGYSLYTATDKTELSYHLENFTTPSDRKIKWSMEGTGPLEGFEVTLPGISPDIKSFGSFSIKKDDDFVLDITPYASGFDSLYIDLYAWLGNNPSIYTKAIASNTTTVTFTKAELQKTTHFIINNLETVYFYLRAVNHAYMTLNNKVYVFTSTHRSPQYLLYIYP